MVEIPQWLINWVFGGACTIFGWFAKALWDGQSKMSQTIQDLELLVVGKYVTTEVMDKRLQRLEDKMDTFGQKIDKIYERVVEK